MKVFTCNSELFNILWRAHSFLICQLLHNEPPPQLFFFFNAVYRGVTSCLAPYLDPLLGTSKGTCSSYFMLSIYKHLQWRGPLRTELHHNMYPNANWKVSFTTMVPTESKHEACWCCAGDTFSSLHRNDQAVSFRITSPLLVH